VFAELPARMCGFGARPVLERKKFCFPGNFFVVIILLIGYIEGVDEDW
jgi:hypothetical protein